MGVKDLISLFLVIVLISACSMGEKTKPVVTDITGDVVKEFKEEESKVEELEEINETILEEVEEEIEINETIEEIEINESEEEEKEQELPPETHIITIKDLRLEPRELTIKKGDTIIWKHEDKWEVEEETRHYLAAHSNEFRSSILYYGNTFNHTFNKTGTFTYIDTIYKDKEYMRGKIIVE